MEGQGKPKLGRLALVVLPFQGHINPMLQLATILHSKGFSITIVHPEFNFPVPTNHPQFTFLSIPGKMNETQVAEGDFYGFVNALNRNCQGHFQAYLSKFLEEDDPQNRIVGVFYDTYMYFAQSVSDQLRLPGFIVRTGPATTILGLSIFHQPNDQQGYVSLLETMSQELMPDPIFHKLKLYHASAEFPSKYLLDVRANITAAMQHSAAIIANTLPFLEEQALSLVEQYFPSKVISIGPFHKLAGNAANLLLKEDRSCISWLDKQSPKSVLYVSFGSVVNMNEKELLEVASGLEQSEQPFLWVVRHDLVPGLDSNTLLPESFCDTVHERGCIVPWAPQKEVLAHSSVRGFWTHSGWNSTLEGACEGVPMLCRPVFGDQSLNVSYVCHIWRIGIELEGELERGNIEKAVRKLMKSKEGDEMMQRAAEIKDKAEVCLQEGGYTFESLNKLIKLLSS